MNSNSSPLPGLFVTGTDTGVGKTRVAGWIVRRLSVLGLRVGVCKPAVTGAVMRPGESGEELHWEDLDALRRSCSLDVPESLIAPYRWRDPLSPAAASAGDANGPHPTLEDYLAALDAWRGRCDFLVVEGVGGLLCPLTEKETVAELAQQWGRPILLVARLGLGTLNHTLLSVEAARSRGLSIAGVLLNRTEDRPDDLAAQGNPAQLRRLLDVPVWGPLPFQATDEPIPREFYTDWSRWTGGWIGAAVASAGDIPKVDSGIHADSPQAPEGSTSSSNIFGSSSEAPAVGQASAPSVAAGSSDIFSEPAPATASPGSGLVFAPAPEPTATVAGWGPATSAASAPTPSPASVPAPSRGSLWPLLFFTWASLATMLSIWLLWNWPEARSPLEDLPDDGKATAEIISPLEPLSSRELCRLGDALQVGDLEVVPIRIEAKPLTILPSGLRTEPALVLHLKLTNRSSDRPLRPMDPVFLYPDPRKKLRGLAMFDQSGYTYTFAHPKGRPESVILPYDLGADSGMKVQGQEFPELKPGQSMEAIVVSEEDAAGRLSDEMVWRVKLRKRSGAGGKGIATVVGVLFSKADVKTAASGG